MKFILFLAALAVAQDFGDPIFSQSATFIETSEGGTQINDGDPCFLYESLTPGLTFGTQTITELCCTDKSQPIDPTVKNENIERDAWYTLFAGTDADNNPALDCELRFTDTTDPTHFDTIFVYIYPLDDDNNRSPVSDFNTQKLTADPIPDQLNILSPPPLSNGDLGSFDPKDDSPRHITVQIFNEVLTEQLEEVAIQIARPSGTYTETTKTGTQRNDNDPCFIWDQVVAGESLGTLTMTELCCTDKSVPTDAIIGANIEREDWFTLFRSDDTLHNPGLDCELRFVDSELPNTDLDTIFVYQYPIGDDGNRITFGSGVTPDVAVTQKLTSDPQPIQLNIFAPPPTSTGELGTGFNGGDESLRTIHIDVFGGKNQRKVTPPAPTGAFTESTTHGTQVNDGDDCFIFDLSTEGLAFGSLTMTNLCCADKSNPVDGSQNHGIDRDEWYTLYNSDDAVNNPAMDCEARFEDSNNPGTFFDTIFVFQFPLDGNGGRVTTSPTVVQKLTSDPIPLQLNILAPPPSATGDLGTFFNDIAASNPEAPRVVNVQISGAQERRSVSDVNVPAPTGGFIETSIAGEQVNDGDPCQIYKLERAGIDFDGLHITELCCTDKSVPIDTPIGANIGRDDWFKLFRSDDTQHNPGLDCELRFTDKDQPDAVNLDTIFVYQYPLKNGRRITFGSGVTADTPVVQKLTADPIPDKLNIFSPPPTSTGDLGDQFTGSFFQEEYAREIFITVFAAKDIVAEDPNGGAASDSLGASHSTAAVLAVIFIALTILALSVVVWHYRCRRTKVHPDHGVPLQETPYSNLAA